MLDGAAFRRCPWPYPCDYTDAQGAVLYRVARWTTADGGKTYSVSHPGPAPDSWQSGRGGAPRVLYGLPEVRAAVRGGAPIYAVEGEKIVHMLRGFGLVATCNDGGAGKFRREHADALRGARRVVVVPDNDEPGKKHAEQTARLLRDVGVFDVRLLALPGLKNREGLDDWLMRRRSS